MIRRTPILCIGKRRNLLQAVTAVLLGILAAIALPAIVGEDFATRESAKLYAPVGAWLYGEGSRQRISTILIDDDSLSQAGQVWPATYGYYARLLRGISHYHPQAIFLDVIFATQRDDPSIRQLSEELCALDKSGVRIYLATTRGQTGAPVLRPELQNISGRCFTSVAVDYRPDEVDRLTWTYDLGSSKPGAPTKSAALAIYDDVSGNPLPTPVSPMAVSWGATPASHGVRWVSANPATSGNADARSTYCRTTYGIVELLPPGIQRLFRNDAQKPLCVFHETEYARDLANATPEEDNEISASLTNRIVMVGTSRAYTNDFITSPLHDRVPGVYLHAMALDNLLTYGRGYKRAPGLTPSNDGDHWRLLLLALASLFSVVVFHRLRALVDAWLVTSTSPQPSHLAPPPEIYIVDTAGYDATRLPYDMEQGHHKGRPPETESRRPSRSMRALCALVAFGLKALGSLAIVAGLLCIGERWLDTGYFSVISIATFSLAAEWLEWNHKLIAWISHEDGKKTSVAH